MLETVRKTHQKTPASPNLHPPPFSRLTNKSLENNKKTLETP